MMASFVVGRCEGGVFPILALCPNKWCARKRCYRPNVQVSCNPSSFLLLEWMLKSSPAVRQSACGMFIMKAACWLFVRPLRVCVSYGMLTKTDWSSLVPHPSWWVWSELLVRGYSRVLANSITARGYLVMQISTRWTGNRYYGYGLGHMIDMAM